MDVTLKPDGSLVTTADEEVERFLRKQLERLVPGASVWGEEYGFDPITDGGTWLVDPIDGTSNFRFGQPLWGVTVAFMRDGRLLAGSVVLPDLGWSFCASLGGGATLNGRPLDPVKKGPIQKFELLGHADDGIEAFSFLPGKRRHLGAFVAEAMFVATGGYRAMTCTKACLYDAAGSLVVLRELGAEFRCEDGSFFDESLWLRPVKMAPFAVVPPEAWPVSLP